MFVLGQSRCLSLYNTNYLLFCTEKYKPEVDNAALGLVLYFEVRTAKTVIIGFINWRIHIKGMDGMEIVPHTEFHPFFT